MATAVLVRDVHHRRYVFVLQHHVVVVKLVKHSIARCCCYTRRLAYRHHGHFGSRSAENVKAQGYRQEASFGRITWVCICDML